jgi:hypothetical protein
LDPLDVAPVMLREQIEMQITQRALALRAEARYEPL